MMETQLEFSGRFEEDIRTLLGLSEHELNQLGNIFEKAPPQFLWRREVRRMVAPVVSAPEKRDEISRIITGLAFMAADHTRGPTALRLEIERGLKDLGFDDGLKRLSRFLESFFGSKEFLLSAKATSLSSEFEQVYSESRILTDVRPVFENDSGCKVLGHFLVHNLKLVVETSEGVRELFVALSEDGLESLGRDIERARLKANELQNHLNGGVLGARVKDKSIKL